LNRFSAAAAAPLLDVVLFCALTGGGFALRIAAREDELLHAYGPRTQMRKELRLLSRITDAQRGRYEIEFEVAEVFYYSATDALLHLAVTGVHHRKMRRASPRVAVSERAHARVLFCRTLPRDSRLDLRVLDLTDPKAAAAAARGFELDAPLFVISVAAQLAGMHAQTLRSYDREGLVSPGRTTGGGRRYSQRDIELLREVQKLSQDEGVNRAGIRRIIELEALVDALREQVADLAAEVTMLREELLESRMDAANAAANAIAGLRRDVVPWQESSTALVAWRRQRRG